MRVDYDEFTITCENNPCKEALKNFYNLLIDNLIKDYGTEVTRDAIEKLIDE